MIFFSTFLPCEARYNFIYMVLERGDVKKEIAGQSL